jgi:hypothetical protein
LKYPALATDYVGTTAHDRVVDEPTIAAPHRARTPGIAENDIRFSLDQAQVGIIGGKQ